MSENNHQNVSTTNSSNPGDTISVFVTHVKQLLLSLPPVSTFILLSPWVLLVVDYALIHLYSNSISQWFYLDVEKVIGSYQVQRLALYPLSSTSFVKALVSTIWLFPEVHKLEKRHGSLKTAWLTLVLYTVVPAIGYTAALKAISFLNLQYEHVFKEAVYSGEWGWIVAFVFWSNLEVDREGSNPNTIMGGTVPMSNKVMPFIAFLVFVVLVPASLAILNIFAGVIACLYVYEKIPVFLLPSNETYSSFEKKAWLSPLTSAPNYVPANQSELYLPIVNPTSGSSVFENISARFNNRTTSSNNSFPGQGHRLGSS
ncbi:hypothetical protein BY458DRAFT_497472 [Sporodiniella umbellata]|nr:hypothetical protein BY458DRAFT_497472 [Sporodiniella umbellata]